MLKEDTDSEKRHLKHGIQALLVMLFRHLQHTMWRFRNQQLSFECFLNCCLTYAEEHRNICTPALHVPSISPKYNTYTAVAAAAVS